MITNKQLLEGTPVPDVSRIHGITSVGLIIDENAIVNMDELEIEVRRGNLLCVHSIRPQ